MSLDPSERRRTSEELRANLALSGLTEREAAAALGFDPVRRRRTLDVAGGADPADVWQLRDLLDRAVRDAGREPVPWTVLTDRARARARGWFGLRR
ncbi:DUF2316 family protein [Streptomyces sp. NPDC048182]|uniref:DUF2316 family protein n=1 Tax=unclassified Streptomyces TaxID=2593676 RepID=UPI0033A83E9D